MPISKVGKRPKWWLKGRRKRQERYRLGDEECYCCHTNSYKVIFF
jgi:hypothetical protein